MPAHPTPHSDQASITPPPPPPARKSRKPSTLKSRQFLSVLVLITALAAGGYAIRYGNFDIRRSANDTPVNFTVQTSTSQVNVGENFTATYIISQNNNHPITAADIKLNFDSSKVQLLSLSPGNFFNSVSNNPTPNQNLSATTILTDIPNRRFALSAPCDPCYLGANPGDGTPACLSNPAPKCYPKNQTGQLFTATFKAVAEGTLSLGISKSNSDITATDNEGDIFGQTTPANITIVDGDPTTPGDTNGDGLVNLLDVQALLSQWGCNSNCTADVNNDGIVDLLDLQLMLSNWTG